MPGYYEFPNNFVQKPGLYLPAYLAGFEHSYYANLDDPINDADFADWVVGLFDTEGNLVESLGAPTQDIVDSPNFRFYLTFTLGANIRGNHYLVVYNSVSSAVIYQSNPVKIIGPEDFENYAYIQMRNTSNLDNFNYEGLPTFYNNYFLDLDAIEYDYEHVINGYKEQSTGRNRNQKTQKAKFVRLQVYLFDEGANDAMASLSDHDTIILNDEVVTVKTGFSPEVQKDMNYGLGIIEFYIERFSTVNLKG